MTWEKRQTFFCFLPEHLFLLVRTFRNSSLRSVRSVSTVGGICHERMSLDKIIDFRGKENNFVREFRPRLKSYRRRQLVIKLLVSVYMY